MSTQPILMLALLGWATLPSLRPSQMGLAEFIDKALGMFGQKVADGSREAMTKRLGLLSERCGADAARVVTQIGPKGLCALEAAGPDAVRLAAALSHQGDQAAWLVAHPARTALIIRHGDDAARALIRHPGVGEAVVQQGGQHAARALAQLDPQNGRRLAMLLQAKPDFGGAQSGKLLTVIADYGNPAMDFIWRNKGALAVTATLAAFVNDPKPFLDGSRDLLQVIGHAAVKPVQDVAREAAQRVNWKWIVLIGLGLLALCLLRRFWSKLYRSFSGK